MRYYNYLCVGWEQLVTRKDTDPPGCEDFPAYMSTYGAQLMGAALIKCGRRVDAEDLVAETLQNLWKAWKQDPHKVRTGGIGYALRALANSAISQGRLRSRRPQEEQWDPILEAEPGRVDVEGTYLFWEFQRELWAAVRTLEQVQQDLIYLHYVQEYSIPTAARQLGLRQTTAYRYRDDALEELKKILSGQEEEQQVG